MGERVAARLARDEGLLQQAPERFDRAIRLFQQIGTYFEADRTRAEAAAEVRTV
ncbi:MAG: hypothetical protein HYY76_19800 [Acidobacteria bacterium]|nr:hypothetical protein [Acidobacteriota bacterium]